MNAKPSKQRGNRPFTKGGKSGPGGKRAIDLNEFKAVL
jgi:hypothetical protein